VKKIFSQLGSYGILITIIWIFGLASSVFRLALILKVSSEYGLKGSDYLSISNALTMVVVSIFIGVIIDRYSKTRILLLSNLMQIIGMSILVFFYIFFSLDLEILLVVAAINSIMFLIINPTIQSLIPELVNTDDKKIVSKTSSFLNVNAIVGMIGPALGGILTSNLPFIHISYVLMALFLLSLVLYMYLLKKLKQENITFSAHLNRKKKNIFIELYDGLSVIGRNKIMAIVFCGFALIDAVTFAIPFYLPNFLSNAKGNVSSIGTLTGLLLASGMFFRVIAMYIYPKLKKEINPTLIFSINLLVHGVSVFLIVFVPSISMKFTGYILMGFLSGLTMITLAKFIHSQVSLDYRGRVFGSLASITTFFKPVFLLTVAEGDKNTFGFLVATILLILIGLIFCYIFQDNFKKGVKGHEKGA
jgi:MFS transporter, DHA3 family, macrolide efflux protein